MAQEVTVHALEPLSHSNDKLSYVTVAKLKYLTIACGLICSVMWELRIETGTCHTDSEEALSA